MADIERSATAVWNGTLREGNGETSGATGFFTSLPVTWASRFADDENGTSPEELIAAAHAACFSMSLSGALTRGGHPPEQIRTTATVGMSKGDTRFSVTSVHLSTEARVPGLDEASFRELAEGAKQGCPVSRLLAPGLESLTLEARLVG
jgi:osmotically inducible protein OsmC